MLHSRNHSSKDLKNDIFKINSRILTVFFKIHCIHHVSLGSVDKNQIIVVKVVFSVPS